MEANSDSQEKAHRANSAGLEVKQQGQDSDAKTDAQAHEATPEHCPRFDHCDAPICPLDRNWLKRRHVDRDPVCLYLRESVKPNARANLAPHLRGELVAVVFNTAPAIIAAQGDIRRRLARASNQASKLAHMTKNFAGSEDEAP
jgi:hypothetical protein